MKGWDGGYGPPWVDYNYGAGWDMPGYGNYGYGYDGYGLTPANAQALALSIIWSPAPLSRPFEDFMAFLSQMVLGLRQSIQSESLLGCASRCLRKTQTEFYFQIDSHMRFVQDWDTLCIEQLQLCESPNPILTTYGSSYSLPKSYRAGTPDCAELISNKALAILCADTFGDANQDELWPDPFLRIKTRSCRKGFLQPPPAFFWTARFSFSRGEVVREVPYDPHLQYVFFGEEISMIAFHLASRAHRYWFREVQTQKEQVEHEQKAKCRICGMLGTPWQHKLHQPPEAPFGLGTQRTLAAYEGFTGVDFKQLQLEPRAMLGGQSPEVFAPLWADEQREKMLLNNQLKDVESWAGKGNKSANANIAVLEAGVNYICSCPQVNLALSKAFSHLAQLEDSSGQTNAAKAAAEQAAHYLSLTKGARATAFWDASTKAAEAALRTLTCSYDYGKGYGKGFGAPKEARGLVRAVVSAQVVPGGKWNNDDNTLFVGGLPPDTTNLEMYQIFSAFGPIAPRGATALLDKDTGKCTGIGFINYMNAEAAEKAIRALNSWPFEDGSRLTVKKKGPPKSKGVVELVRPMVAQSLLNHGLETSLVRRCWWPDRFCGESSACSDMRSLWERLGIEVYDLSCMINDGKKMLCEDVSAMPFSELINQHHGMCGTHACMGADERCLHVDHQEEELTSPKKGQCPGDARLNSDCIRSSERLECIHLGMTTQEGGTEGDDAQYVRNEFNQPEKYEAQRECNDEPFVVSSMQGQWDWNSWHGKGGGGAMQSSYGYGGKGHGGYDGYDGSYENYDASYGGSYSHSVPDYGKGTSYNDKGKGGKNDNTDGAPKEIKGLVRSIIQAQAMPDGRSDESTIFVAGLPSDMTNLEMYQLFSAFGAIAPRGATALQDKETGKCTGVRLNTRE
eukprot:g20257.t1